MPFPTLSRRHVATPCNRSQSRSPTKSTNRTSPTKSPQKGARTESLRSTWMTTGSDCIEEELELSQVSDVDSNALQMVTQVQHPLSDWAYWQRDAVALPDCWTRVFAVFCRNVLWLYRYEDASANSLLVCMRVLALDVGTDSRQLKFRDGGSAASVQLWMPDAVALNRWYSHVSIAVATPVQREKEEESRALVVPAVASAMKQRRFWKGLATAVVLEIKPLSFGQNRGHEETNLVVRDTRSRTSLSQRWKHVTTVFKSTFKRSRHLQLQVQGERATVG